MSRNSFANREPDRDPEGQTLLSETNAVPPADDVSNQRSKRARAALWTVLGTVVFALIIHISSSGAAKPKYVASVFTLAAKHRQCPSWFNAMRSDFLLWKEKGGIDLADVAAAQPFASSRFQIINGSLYAEHFAECWQTRKRYTIWGLLMFLRHFGDQVADVDFMFDCGDMPRVWRSANPADPVPALFTYNKQEGSLDLPLPDWSFWGWPEVDITRWADHGKKIMDAGRQHKDWKKRKPTAFWKGNIGVTGGLTSRLRENLTACTADPRNGVEAYNKDWNQDPEHKFDDTRQWQQCGWRYRIYAEGFAWSVSMKYGMACGAVMLIIDPFFSAFYHPGLDYGNNSLLIQRIPLCESFREQIDWANRHPAAAEAIGQAGLRFVEQDLSMDRVYDYMLHKFNMYGALQTFKPVRGERSVLVTEEDVLQEASEIEREKYLLREPPLRRHVCEMQAEKPAGLG